MASFSAVKRICAQQIGTVFVIKLKSASWSSGNAYASGAGGLRFKSRTG